MVSGSTAIFRSYLVLYRLVALTSSLCCSNRSTKSFRTKRLSRFFASPSQLQGGSLGMPICFSPASAPEHLVDGLRAAGLLVIRPLRWELHR
jgi:hypothetical protein